MDVNIIVEDDKRKRIVEPWGVRVSKGRNITWKLKDKTGVYDPRPSINNDGKSQGEVIPPIVHEGPNSVTHGPFNEVTPDGEWWKYNIVLTKMGGGGQEVIDPDYRVDP